MAGAHCLRNKSGSRLFIHTLEKCRSGWATSSFARLSLFCVRVRACLIAPQIALHSNMASAVHQLRTEATTHNPAFKSLTLSVPRKGGSAAVSCRNGFFFGAPK